MIQGLKAIRKIQSVDGHSLGLIEIPLEMENVETADSILMPQEAVERGYDLSTAKTQSGEPLFTSDEIQRLYLRLIRGVKSIENGYILADIPNAQSRQEAYLAQQHGMKQAVTQLEQIRIPVLNEVNRENKGVEAVKLSQEVGQSIVSLPTTKGDKEKAVYVAPLAENQPKNYVLTAELGKDDLAVEINQALQGKYKFKLFQEKLYLFDDKLRYYRKLSQNRLDYLVNAEFGEIIKKTGNPGIYRTVQSFLTKEASLVVPESYAIPDEYFIFRDMIVNTLTWKTWPNDGSIFITNALQAKYNPSALCPNFDDFVANVAGRDNALTALIWETLGYLFSHDVSAKTFFVFFGVKDTGKSLLAKVIEYIVGCEATTHLSLNDFGGRFDVAELCGAHLNICADLPATPISTDSVGKIKAFTGNDGIRSDVKNKEAISFMPTAHLLFATNNPLTLAVKDVAFEERMVQIPFNNPVPKHRQKAHLFEELIEEADGICAKALKAYVDLRSRAYRFSSLSYGRVKGVLDTNAIFKDLIAEYYEITERPEDMVPIPKVYELFADFCVKNQIGLNLSIAQFSAQLRAFLGDSCGHAKRRCDGFKNPVNMVTGLRLKLNEGRG